MIEGENYAWRFFLHREVRASSRNRWCQQNRDVTSKFWILPKLFHCASAALGTLGLLWLRGLSFLLSPLTENHSYFKWCHSWLQDGERPVNSLMKWQWCHASSLGKKKFLLNQRIYDQNVVAKGSEKWDHTGRALSFWCPSDKQYSLLSSFIKTFMKHTCNSPQRTK